MTIYRCFKEGHCSWPCLWDTDVNPNIPKKCPYGLNNPNDADWKDRISGKKLIFPVDRPTYLYETLWSWISSIVKKREGKI